MYWKRQALGGTLAFIGFMLSPLSWWNDLFVNVPLALGFGWLVSLAWKPAFEYAVIAGYWLTNVLGFVLLHKGVQLVVRAGHAPPPFLSRHGMGMTVFISLLYTLLILALVKLKVLQPLRDYLPQSARP